MGCFQLDDSKSLENWLFNQFHPFKTGGLEFQVWIVCQKIGRRISRDFFWWEIYFANNVFFCEDKESHIQRDLTKQFMKLYEMYSVE